MKLIGKLVCLVSATLMLTSSPAWAKGKEPVIIRIQGPGLVHPVVVRGQMGSPYSLGDHYWALAYQAIAGSTVSAPPPASLGPRYTFVYVDPCCGHRVTQYVYPFAAGGPLVFTPKGQQSAAFQMQFTDLFPGFSAGWSRAPSSTLTRTLEDYGVPRPAASPSTGGSNGRTLPDLWLLAALLAVGFAVRTTLRGIHRRSSTTGVTQKNPASSLPM